MITTVANIKYKEPVDPSTILTLIDYKSSNAVQSTIKTEEFIKKTFPIETKHNYMFEKIPPAKYSTLSNKSYYNVYEFPVVSQ